VNGGGGYHGDNQEPANMEMEDMEWKAQVSFFSGFLVSRVSCNQRFGSAFTLCGFGFILFKFDTGRAVKMNEDLYSGLNVTNNF
jgi:hypothetical protein